MCSVFNVYILFINNAFIFAFRECSFSFSSAATFSNHMLRWVYTCFLPARPHPHTSLTTHRAPQLPCTSIYMGLHHSRPFPFGSQPARADPLIQKFTLTSVVYFMSQTPVESVMGTFEVLCPSRLGCVDFEFTLEMWRKPFPSPRTVTPPFLWSSFKERWLSKHLSSIPIKTVLFSNELQTATERDIKGWRHSPEAAF